MNTRKGRIGALGAAALAIGVLLTACGSTGSTGSTADEPGNASSDGDVADSAGDGDAPAPVLVVASTDVYGSIVELVGGERVSVTSIISDPSQDPHSYEANTQNQLALSKAALVVENGGGYDDFIDQMLKASGNDGVTVLNAVEVSGVEAHDGGELNEHVWYDVPAMKALSGSVADALAAIDPAGAADYRSGASEFERQLGELQDREAAIKTKYDGTAVAITEPVPLYMLDAMGLVNRTPEEFSEAIEEDSDVPPLVMKETLDILASGQVRALVYNEQTSGPETDQVLAAAEKAGVPAVPVTETLPDGQNYLSWMNMNLDAISAALDEGGQ